MKRLTLIRHAKSSWDDPHQADFDRPLNARGLRAAPLVGQALRASDFKPDLIVSSPANRAISTAKIIAENIGYPERDIAVEPRIYEAGLNELLAIARGLPDTHAHVCLFGHNPGFHELANHLLPAPLAKLPTCAVVDMRLPAESWSEIRSDSAALQKFLTPNTLLATN